MQQKFFFDTRSLDMVLNLVFVIEHSRSFFHVLHQGCSSLFVHMTTLTCCHRKTLCSFPHPPNLMHSHQVSSRNSIFSCSCEGHCPKIASYGASPFLRLKSRNANWQQSLPIDLTIPRSNAAISSEYLAHNLTAKIPNIHQDNRSSPPSQLSVAVYP